MSLALRPYPRYRASGVPWLGEIPEHWEIRRNGRLFGERKETGFPDLPILEVSLRTGVRVRDVDGSKRKQMMSDLAAYKRAVKGDIAYNMMRMWQGAVGVAPVDGLISPAYVVARPRPETDSGYYAYLFRTAAYMDEVDKFSHGIVKDRNRLYWDEFKQMPSAYPPVAEQRAIVSFLDAHGALVRQLVRAKRRLITLLEEEKHAIIRRAVTRDNGHHEQREVTVTDVDWFSSPPPHWTIEKLKNVTEFHNGLAFKPSDWRQAGTAIIRIQNLNGGDDFNYTERIDLPRSLLIEPGELLFAWSGNRGTSFGPFLWDRPFAAYLNQHIFKLSGYSLHRRFFYYLLKAVTTHVEEQTHGIIGLVHITKPELGAIRVPVPPFVEQQQIADRIDRDCSDIESAQQRIRSELALIDEYRVRLVTDAVAGRLDVRAAATSRPESCELACEMMDEVSLGESPDELRRGDDLGEDNE